MKQLDAFPFRAETGNIKAVIQTQRQGCLQFERSMSEMKALVSATAEASLGKSLSEEMKSCLVLVCR